MISELLDANEKQFEVMIASFLELMKGYSVIFLFIMGISVVTFLIIR